MASDVTTRETAVIRYDIAPVDRGDSASPVRTYNDSMLSVRDASERAPSAAGYQPRYMSARLAKYAAFVLYLIIYDMVSN